MTNRMALTKKGYNVLTETDVNKFIIDTSKNTLKIIGEGSLSLNLGLNAFSVQAASVSHGFNFRPIVYAFCKYDSKVYLPGEGMAALDDSFPTYFSALGASNQKIYFFYTNYTAGAIPVVFKFYIFEVPI